MTIGLRWGAATDAGRVRELNEDSLLAEPPLFAVADGVGGHAAGEVASGIAVVVDVTAVEPGGADTESSAMLTARSGGADEPGGSSAAAGRPDEPAGLTSPHFR